MKESPRIIFFGTPEFAVASLQALLDHGYHVVAVVTAPDKPAGRGLKPGISAVKEFALTRNLPVLQPVKLKNESFLQELNTFEPDLQIIIAFRMLPKEVWSLPSFGTFNLHASLLPQYRGAAPIHRAVINGEQVTGVTTFFINEEIDTGKIIDFQSTTIDPDETTGELHDRLMGMGAELVVKTVGRIIKGDITLMSQNNLEIMQGELKKAPKIFREDCQIDHTLNARKLHDFIRGMSPYPGAFTIFQGDDGIKYEIKILRSKLDINHSKPGGEPLSRSGREYLYIRAANGWLRVLEVKMSGKKVMTSGEFLRGYSRIIPEIG